MAERECINNATAQLAQRVLICIPLGVPTQRILFLESIAGVPGMVGAVLRHLRSLRSMKRDNGFIHLVRTQAGAMYVKLWFR